MLSLFENARVLLTLVFFHRENHLAFLLFKRFSVYHGQVMFIYPHVFLGLQGRLFQVSVAIKLHQLLDLPDCKWINARHSTKRLHIYGFITTILLLVSNEHFRR